MPRVALATCAELPQLDAGERRVVAPLRERGIDAAFAVWDDPSVDWSAFDLVVVRATWDYARRRDAFLAWAASVPRLRNPEPVLRWNTDKRYLADLEAAGVPVVPTAFVAPGEAFSLPGDAGDLVVKPAVSAGSADTARYPARETHRAGAHVAELHAEGRVAMVQPYLGAVDCVGETALLAFGGRFSHAIRKGPLLSRDGTRAEGLFALEDISPRTPSRAERELGEAVLDLVAQRFGAQLYARVDLLPGPAGDPVVIEVELTEPSLFLDHDPDAPARFADAIAAELR